MTGKFRVKYFSLLLFLGFIIKLKPTGPKDHFIAKC